MEELLQQLMQQHGQQAVVDNTEVPNEHNESVMQDVMANIMGGLKDHAGAGDVLSGLMRGGAQQNTSGGLGSILSSVLGGGAQQNQNSSGGIGDLLGSVLGGGQQNQNPAGGGLGSILSNVLGGAGGNNNSNPIMGAIQQQVIGSLMAKFGLSNQAAGGVASGMVQQVLSGLLNHHNEQAPQQQQNQEPSGGGIADLLGGIFGK